jgi:hypothetical protein
LRRLVCPSRGRRRYIRQLIGAVDEFDHHARRSAIGEAELHCGGVREIDEPFAVERSPIIHADDRGSMVVEIGDADIRRYRQVRCAAVSLYMSYNSPLEVRWPWNFVPYHDALPYSL